MYTINVSAVTGIDDIGDVYDGISKIVVSKPNIDITTMTYELKMNNVTLTMTVDGNISDSETVQYSITLSNDINSSTGYTMYYTNGTGRVLKDWSSQVDSNIWISNENTIVVTFELSENEISDFNLFMGFNTEYNEDTKELQWVDSAPDDYVTAWYGGEVDDNITNDNNETNDDTINEKKNGGTPGFQFLLVLLAISLYLFWKKK
jgi:hypothetical protein